MIIDAHVQVGTSINGYALTPEDLLAGMKTYGIDAAVISPVQPYSYHLDSQNDYISSLAMQHAGTFIGFCRVDPRQGEAAVSELNRAFSELKLRGLYLHPWEEGYQANAGYVISVVEQASKLQMPVMIATGYPWVSHALQVADLAERVPDAQIIMTHGGQLNVSGRAQADAYLAMRTCPNLYIETSGVYRQDFIENVISEFGDSRVLFGSNSPLMHQGFELDRVYSACRDMADKSRILGGNISRLIGL
jgi:predicted TIM-barrel fold metal-dependent hydrolase